jgi:DNA-binding MarR family transcriptional regulator
MPFDLTPSLDFLLAQKMDHLTTRQLAVLLACRDGAQTVRGLAEKMGVQKPAITRAADKLVEHDLIVRKHDPIDRRSVLISLTAAGKKFAKNFA